MLQSALYDVFKPQINYNEFREMGIKVMSHAVFLKITPQTHQRFEAVRATLNAGSTESQSKELGNIMAEIGCEIIQQVFGNLLEKQKQSALPGSESFLHESEKVVQHILDTFRKYMPWSVSFFGNERLLPLVNYFATLLHHDNNQIFVRYTVDAHLANEALSLTEKVREGQLSYVPKTFSNLTKIVDLGVTALVREPKKMLKFNMVVDKTLNGVINMTTSLGYKRLEKLGSQLDHKTANDYGDHFIGFLQAHQ